MIKIVEKSGPTAGEKSGPTAGRSADLQLVKGQCDFMVQDVDQVPHQQKRPEESTVSPSTHGAAGLPANWAGGTT